MTPDVDVFIPEGLNPDPEEPPAVPTEAPALEDAAAPPPPPQPSSPAPADTENRAANAAQEFDSFLGDLKRPKSDTEKLWDGFISRLKEKKSSMEKTGEVRTYEQNQKSLLNDAINRPLPSRDTSSDNYANDQAPAPADYEDFVERTQDAGLSLTLDEDRWQDLSDLAGLITHTQFQGLGIWNIASADTWDEAYRRNRYNLALLHSDPSDTERTSTIRDGVLGALSHAQGEINAKIHQVRAQIEAGLTSQTAETYEQQLEKLNKDFATLQGFASRLKEDEPGLTAAAEEVAKLAVRNLRAQGARQELELQGVAEYLDRLTPDPRPEKAPHARKWPDRVHHPRGVKLGGQVSRDLETEWQRTDTIVRILREALPEGTTGQNFERLVTENLRQAHFMNRMKRLKEDGAIESVGEVLFHDPKFANMLIEDAEQNPAIKARARKGKFTLESAYEQAQLLGWTAPAFPQELQADLGVGTTVWQQDVESLFNLPTTFFQGLFNATHRGVSHVLEEDLSEGSTTDPSGTAERVYADPEALGVGPIDSSGDMSPQRALLLRDKAAIQSGDVDVQTAWRYGNRRRNLWAWASNTFWDSVHSGALSGSISAKLGPLAKAAQEIPASVMKKVMEEARNKFAERVSGSDNLDELRDALLGEAAGRYREGDILGGFSDGLGGVMVMAFDEIREAYHFAISDPEEFATVNAMGWAAGVVGSPVIAKGAGRMTHSMNRWRVTNRLRRAMASLNHHDPATGARIHQFLRQNPSFFRDSNLSEHQIRSITAITQNLAEDSERYFRDAANLTEKTHAQFWRKRTKDVNRLYSASRAMDYNDLTELLRGAGVGEEVLNFWEQNLVPSETVDFVSEILSRAGGRNWRLFPEIQSRLTNAANELRSLIDNGGSLAEVQSVPIPMTGVGNGGPTLVRRALDRVPFLRDKYGFTDAQSQAVAAQTGRIIDQSAPAIIALRDMQSLAREEQKLLVRNVRARKQAELDDARNTVERMQDPDYPLETEIPDLPEKINVAKLEEEVAYLDTVLEEVSSRPWKEPTRLSQNRRFINQMSMEDIWLWTRLRHTPEQLWTRLARENETLPALTKEFDELVARERDMNEGRVPRSRHSEINRQIRQAKRRIAKGLYDREGALKDLRVDVESDEALPWNQALKLRRKRMRVWRKAQKEIDDDTPKKTRDAIYRARAQVEEAPDLFTPERNFGIATEPVREPLRKLAEIDAHLSAADRDGLREALAGVPAQAVSAGPLQMRAAEAMIRHQKEAYIQKHNRFQAELRKLPRDDRRAFHDALEKIAQGDPEAMRVWLQGRPAFVERFGIADRDSAIARAWQDLEDVRSQQLHMFWQAGAISDEAYQTWVKPYSAQLYMDNEIFNLAPEHAKKRLPKNVADGLGTKGVRKWFEFERQRDLYKWKFIVRRKGRPWVEETFDGPEDAIPAALTEYAQKNHGLKDLSTIQGNAGFRTRDDFGNQVLILRPLGQQAVEDLGLIDRGAALGRRIAQLTDDAAVLQFTRILDRPGWAYTNAEFQKARHLKQLPEEPHNYMQLPNIESLGSLRSKWVHKRVINQLGVFEQSRNFLDVITNEMADMGVSDMVSFGTKTMASVTRFLSMQGGLGRHIRKLIARNQISMSLRAYAMNLFSDKKWFAENAYPGYNSSANGREGLRMAKEDLFSEWSYTQEAPPDAGTLRDQWRQESIEDGARGSTMIGNVLDSKARQVAVDNIFGLGKKGPLGIAEAATRDVLTEAGSDDFAQIFREFGDVDGIPTERARALAERLDNVRRQQKRIAKAEPKNRVEAKANERRLTRLNNQEHVIGRVLEEELSGRGMWRRLYDAGRWILGRDRFGSFEEYEGFFQDLYQRVSTLHRLGVYYNMRLDGVPRSVARKRIANHTQDYAMIPASVRKAGESPLANPIFSFPFEATRTAFNNLTQQPFRTVATLFAAPGISTLSGLAQGMSMQEIWAYDDADSPLQQAINFFGRVRFAHPDGGLWEVDLTPVIPPLAVLDKGYGPLRGVIEGIEKNYTMLSSVFGAAGRVASSFFGNHPVVDATTRFIFGRDPISSKPLAGGVVNRFAQGLEAVTDQFIPSTFPFLSTTADYISRQAVSPPHMNTDRKRTAAEVLLQSTLGLRTEGGGLDAFLDTIGVKDTVDSGLNVLMETVHDVGDWDPSRVLQRAFGEELPDKEPIAPASITRRQGLSDEDTILQLWYAAAKGRSGGFGDDADDRQYQERLRYLEWVERFAERKGEKKLLEAVKRYRGQTLRSYEEWWEANREIENLTRADSDPIQGGRRIEVLKQLDKARKRLDFGPQFATSGLVRQVRTLIAGSRMGLDDRLLLQLAARVTHNTDGTGALMSGARREPTNVSDLQIARQEIENYFGDLPPQYATGLRGLQDILTMIYNEYPDALQYEGGKEIESLMRAESTKEYKDAMGSR